MHHFVRKILYNVGVKVGRVGTPLHSYKEYFQRLGMLGFRPNSVIDVGVAEGTEGLYGSFPTARLLLIEPLQEYRLHLERIVGKWGGEYIIAAAGAHNGNVQISVGADGRKSSVLRKELRKGVGEVRTIPMIRLDDVVRERGYTGPFLLKVDVEGAELMVLEGAHGVLAGAGVVVLETGLWDTGGAPEFAETVARMKELGFVVHNVIGAAPASNGGLRHVDLAFVKEAGPLRQ